MATFRVSDIYGAAFLKADGSWGKREEGKVFPTQEEAFAVSAEHSGRYLFSEDAAFASDLGLKPGQWPASVSFEGKIWKRGAEQRGEELEAVLYFRTDGRLLIWND